MPLINQSKAERWVCTSCRKPNEFHTQRDWCKKCGRIHWIDENEKAKPMEASHER